MIIFGSLEILRNAIFLISLYPAVADASSLKCVLSYVLHISPTAEPNNVSINVLEIL